MRPKHYIVILLLGILYIAFTAFSFQNNEDKSNKEIIKFSHQFHLEEDLACTDCHTETASAIDLKRSLLPSEESCADCHDVEDENECSTCHYENIQVTFPIKKHDLHFNHKQHLQNKNTKCTECHSGLEKVDYSFESNNLNPKMENCYECHNSFTETKPTNIACESCHVSTANLFPEDHKIVNFNEMHKFSSMEADANCQMCHDNNFCESCHVGTTMITESNSADDFYAPYSPHNYIDNTKQQLITRVHDLNYRYNHGIDAKGKSSNCITCHQTETFCTECHNSTGSGDFALSGFVPSSHTQNNFIITGVGSGGGLHAEIAKRDIENCAACHDTQGADPNCILCHTDNDGIKGTNNKTHLSGFMMNEHGDWHGDFGAICYNCHTDAGALSQTKGQGFCGYCHN